MARRATREESYYEILGIATDATDVDIRRAYKKLSLRWHPDKNRDNIEEAGEMFKKIAEAYEVLSDPERRLTYDRYGKGGLEASAANDDSGFASYHDPHMAFRRAEDLFNAFFGHDTDDFFRDPFGMGMGMGMGFGRSERRQGSRRTMDPFASMFADDFFGSDPFASFDQLANGMAGGSTFISSSSTSSSGFGGRRGGRSKTTSTSTTIGPDGRRVTRTTTTIVHPDGRQETTSEETVDDVPVRYLDNSHQSSRGPTRIAVRDARQGSLLGRTDSVEYDGYETTHRSRRGRSRWGEY